MAELEAWLRRRIRPVAELEAWPRGQWIWPPAARSATVNPAVQLGARAVARSWATDPADRGARGVARATDPAGGGSERGRARGAAACATDLASGGSECNDGSSRTARGTGGDSGHGRWLGLWATVALGTGCKSNRRQRLEARAAASGVSSAVTMTVGTTTVDGC